MKIVLVNPDIPWNAGNIGRSCVATRLAPGSPDAHFAVRFERIA